MTERPTFVKVWPADGTPLCFVGDDEPRIDCAVNLWMESGCTRDTLLDLSGLDGTRWRMLASDVRAWMVSTPESRRRSMELDAAADEEDKALRAELGLWDAEV